MESNIVNRNIMLFGEITTELIKDVVDHMTEILAYDNHMEKTLKEYEREPIMLIICSGGGEMSPSVGLCEFIVHSPTPIVTVVYGMACSAAFMILICGHYRLADKGSSLMAYHMSAGQFGSTKDCENAINHWKKLDQYMIGLMQMHTKIPQTVIDEIYEKQIDKCFTVEEALELGIIDDIYGHEKIEDEETDETEDVVVEESEDPANI